jgi:dicarboxylate transporter 10
MITHPLDTIKVQLQTQQKVQFGFFGMTVNIVKNSGFFALYNGISAAVLRQATYSTTRFACYEILKNTIQASAKTYASGVKQEMPFYQKILLAGGSGFLGGVVGTPADLANVRMQNDSKLPLDQRRNYKNCVEALVRIARTEGVSRLFAGTSMASTRGMLVTIGQIAFYDEIKYRLIKSTYFKDNLTTHFTASLSAGVIATIITMPLDVLKTRIMNAKPGQYSGVLDCARDIAKVGPSGFFKGFTPAFVRLGPHTILTFVFLEQLKKLY